MFVDIGNQCRNLQLYRDFEDRVSVKDRTGKTIGKIKDYDIEFKNVSFKYPRSKDYTLKNISIRVHSGEKLSVVGRNGAGKTTFIKLLTRLYEPTEGEILEQAGLAEDFKKLLKGIETSVYISHRLSSCKFCDKIAVFDNGAIVQYGSHDELILDADKQYAKMYNAQAKYYV